MAKSKKYSVDVKALAKVFAAYEFFNDSIIRDDDGILGTLQCVYGSLDSDLQKALYQAYFIYNKFTRLTDKR